MTKSVEDSVLVDAERRFAAADTVEPGPESDDSGGVAKRMPQRPWHLRHRILLAASDIVGIAVSLALARGLTMGMGSLREPYTLQLSVFIGFVWVVVLGAGDGYETRRLGSDHREWFRVARAGLVTAATCIASSFFFEFSLGRAYVLVVFALGTVLLGSGRTIVRHVVKLRRKTRGWHHRILAVGSSESVRYLVETSGGSHRSGLEVVAACVDDAEIGEEIVAGVTVVGRVNNAAVHAMTLSTDVIALSGGGLGPTNLKELRWDLEVSGRSLIMAPGLSDIAQPRLHMRPVSGLPLVWVDQPQFSGPARTVKRVFDVLAASFGLVLIAPLLAAVSLAIKLTSPGPVFFRQSRLGKNGVEFMVLKFRTMFIDAELRRDELLDLNQTDGSLFKIKIDPRITRVGSFLRGLSLDELPQLINVLKGEMSLVGPRPLPTVDSTYTGHARRRLLVRPGITGLWQVSGRSDLSWDESVRLDLYYVENWSLGLDVSLVGRTISAVLRKSGAY